MICDSGNIEASSNQSTSAKQIDQESTANCTASNRKCRHIVHLRVRYRKSPLVTCNCSQTKETCHDYDAHLPLIVISIFIGSKTLSPIRIEGSWVFSVASRIIFRKICCELPERRRWRDGLVVNPSLSIPYGEWARTEVGTATIQMSSV